MSSYSLITVSTNADMDLDYLNGYQILLLNASGGSFSINLTDQGVNYGSAYVFIRTDTVNTNTITINAKTGYTINGNASVNIEINKYVEFICNGYNWLTLNFTI